MTYAIEPDDMLGRVHYTKVEEAEVSTVDMEGRYNDPVTGVMAITRDMVFGNSGRYETAIVWPNETRPVAACDEAEDVESQHRRVVEELLDDNPLEPLLPPFFYKEED